MRRLFATALAGIATTFLARPGGAQQPATTGVLAGRVLDAATNEARPGAAVSIVGTSRGVIADDRGQYVIPAIPAGAITIRARLLGYRPAERAVVVRAGDTTRVDLVLQAEATVLGTVRTEARPVERELFESKPSVGTVQITARAAEGVPKLGESDIIRVVQLLPGVEARNDFSTGLNVRGGESDQNLVLLDGYPIYNPFHLGGLFSTFIDPTVRDVTLITGGFPSRYGGRLSSVLDIRSAEEVRSGVHGSAQVSLLASTGAVGGAFHGGQGSWMVAGRRTYADKFVGLISNNELPYHFRDGQAHLSYAFTPTLRFSLTAYDGRDDLDASIATFGDSTSGATAAGGDFAFDWGNRVVGASLSKLLVNDHRRGVGRWLLGDSTMLEQRVSHSTFSTGLDLGDGALTLYNRVRDFRAAGSVSAHSERHDRSIGYDVAGYDVVYDAQSAQTGTSLYDLRQHPMSAGLYIDDMWRASPALLLQTGLRAEALTDHGWTGLSPRVSAKYFLTKDMAVTGAVGRFTQWTHSLAREDVPVRLFDFWLASDSTLPVTTAWHYVLGTERWFSSTRYGRIEGFYKQYSNLLEGNPQEDPDRRGDEFLLAEGNSYGVDLLLRQFEAGRFSGWISYTYAVAARTSQGVRYYPGHDRRHNLNVVASWRLSKYLFGARYGFATGTPYTDIVGQVVRRVYDPGTNAFGTRGSGSQAEFIGGPRNGARLPSTQRLDLDVTRHFQVGGTTISPYFSIVNASNVKNVFLYVFDYSKAPPTRQAISQFPFLPSAGVTIAF